MKRTGIFTALCTAAFFTYTTQADAQVYMQLYAGAGFPYASVKETNTNNHFAVTPMGGVSVLVPVTNFLTLETGAGYSIKGWSDDNSFVWPTQTDLETRYRARNRSQYLNIPLVLNFSLPSVMQGKLSVGVGMNYGVLLDAVMERDDDIYRNGEKVDKQTYRIKVEKKLVNGYKGESLYASGFDAALKLQVSYYWKYNLGIRLFHEHSLYDYYLSTSQDNFKLRYSGVSVVYTIGKR